MRALVHEEYGGPEGLVLREVPLPEPGEGQVRVRVRATTMNADIWHVLSGRPYILRALGAGVGKPKAGKIPGTDVAGIVEAMGPGVKGLEPGDRVFGEVCEDYQWKHGGSYAEAVCVKARDLTIIPQHVSFEEATTVPTSAMIALRSLQIGQLGAGQHVLINGAAGNVGKFAVQVAKALGAEVTAVDCGAKLPTLDGLGVDHLVDYEKERVVELARRHDVILDIASTLSFLDCRSILTPRGNYVYVGHDHYGALGRDTLGCLPEAFGLMFASFFFRQLPKVRFDFDQRALLLNLAELLEQRKLTPQVERSFSLEEVPEAYEYLLSGRARGHLVITP